MKAKMKKRLIIAVIIVVIIVNYHNFSLAPDNRIDRKARVSQL